MSFQISALDGAQFANLFDLSDYELSAINARRLLAQSGSGYPCRVSLQDAAPGEELLLLNYQHLDVATPFRSNYAIYVRKNSETAALPANAVPDLFRTRVLSLRGFSAEGMLLKADLADGRELESKIEDLLQNTDVDFLHLHYAKPGCYAARVDRTAL